MEKEIVISPIFYMGNKRKLINKGLIDLFPKNIEIFADVFGGSGIISMNTKASKYILNDLDTNVFNFYSLFKHKNANEIVDRIKDNLNKFDLPRIGTKQNTPEASKYKERYVALRKYANTTKNIIDLYSCMFYAFSQQMRFNNKGEFNMPFGNGAFTDTNENYIINGCNFFANPQVHIYNKDFKNCNFDFLDEKDFVYLDPPYSNTTATYNENNAWGLEDDYELFRLCDKLTTQGVKWGMSNVFENKGNVNQHLIDWVNKNGYNVHFFDGFNYVSCGKGNAKTVEVFIFNY